MMVMVEMVAIASPGGVGSCGRAEKVHNHTAEVLERATMEARIGCYGARRRKWLIVPGEIRDRFSDKVPRKRILGCLWVSWPDGWLADHLLIEVLEFFIEQPEFPEGIWECLEIFLVVRTEVKVPLATSGWGPRMLLNTLQCRGQPPQQSVLQPQRSVVLSLRNLVMRNHSGRSNSKSIV